MNDPWAFGWTQLFAIAGLVITVSIAIGGFRTFGRWKKEKIEEKRIDTAIDALALTYESKFIFDNIRSGVVFVGEYDDMPRRPGDSDQMWEKRGSYYVILKRIGAAKDFFERAWKLQVRCAAIFGPKAEETFLLLQRARRQVEVSAVMLRDDPIVTVPTEDNKNTWRDFHDDVWAPQAQLPGHTDKVGQMLSDFRTQVEQLCRPVVDRGFRIASDRGFFRRIFCKAG
jgi:hypothetical protein